MLAQKRSRSNNGTGRSRLGGRPGVASAESGLLQPVLYHVNPRDLTVFAVGIARRIGVLRRYCPRPL